MWTNYKSQFSAQRNSKKNAYIHVGITKLNPKAILICYTMIFHSNWTLLGHFLQGITKHNLTSQRIQLGWSGRTSTQNPKLDLQSKHLLSSPWFNFTTTNTQNRIVWLVFPKKHLKYYNCYMHHNIIIKQKIPAPSISEQQSFVIKLKEENIFTTPPRFTAFSSIALLLYVSPVCAMTCFVTAAPQRRYHRIRAMSDRKHVHRFYSHCTLNWYPSAAISTSSKTWPKNVIPNTWKKPKFSKCIKLTVQYISERERERDGGACCLRCQYDGQIILHSKPFTVRKKTVPMQRIQRMLKCWLFVLRNSRARKIKCWKLWCTLWAHYTCWDESAWILKYCCLE